MPTKKINLYIPIEQKVREFVSTILLSNIAIDNNFRCYVGSKRKIHKLISKNQKPEGIYLSKSLLTETEYRVIKKGV